jgi:U3 small nucleolar RNA-associated protein 12
LGNISAEEHVLRTLRKVPTPALNDALLVIPFSTLPTLFTFLGIFLQKRMQPELAWRITYFMLQAHMTQIVASKQLKGVLTDVYEAYERWQEEEQRVMGFNLAGLEIMSREAREIETDMGYLDAPVEEEKGLEKGRKKRAFASVA